MTMEVNALRSKCEGRSGISTATNAKRPFQPLLNPSRLKRHRPLLDMASYNTVECLPVMPLIRGNSYPVSLATSQLQTIFYLPSHA